MKIVPKVCILFLLLPASLFAQPGVRMSADFLPLEVGNRWVYDLLNENGQKLGALDFAVQEYRIVGGRSFYLLTSFPFVTEDTTPTKLIRYDRQERYATTPEVAFSGLKRGLPMHRIRRIVR